MGEVDGKEQLKRELADRQANLAAYELYFRNMALGFGLEELVQKKLKHRENVKMLDIGCGKAVALRELKGIFGKKLFAAGIDAVKEEKPGIDEFIFGDALEANFPENCDIIVSFRAMHEIGHSRKIIEKTERALAKHGDAFLSIRCQEFRENRAENLGKMSLTDIEFLLEIAGKKKINSLKIWGKAVPVAMQGIILDKIGEKRLGVLQYIAGVNLHLKKT